MEDERKIIEAAVGGEESAFEELVIRYTPLVAGYIRARTRYSSEIEDVIQEVFLGVYRQIDSLKSTRAFVPWLLMIARHKMSDQNRRERRVRAPQTDSEAYRVTPLVVSEVADPAPGPSKEAEIGILQENLRDSVDRLAEKLYVVLYLRLWEECSIREIAERLRVKESTVRVRLHRGMKILRSDLQRQGIGSSGKVYNGSKESNRP
jgi:RNA polymerase sigma-70 factor (ECF subfamily)